MGRLTLLQYQLVLHTQKRVQSTSESTAQHFYHHHKLATISDLQTDSRVQDTRPAPNEVDDTCSLHGDILLYDDLDRFLGDEAAEEGCSVGEVCCRCAGTTQDQGNTMMRYE